MNIADLADPNAEQGRTYRQVNHALVHKHELGALVELSTGVRLFIAKQTRDCDGTPLYILTYENPEHTYPLTASFMLYGVPDADIKSI